MKNALLILLLVITGGIYAQNNNCNFTMELQGSLLKDSTYSLESISIAGLKMKHQINVLSMIDFKKDQTITLNVQFFETFLDAICRYKKYSISKVMVGGNGDSGQLLLVYEKK
jgi:hypothetical protein